ncbi:MAG: TolC family protein [Bacteroidales bacterium]
MKTLPVFITLMFLYLSAVPQSGISHVLQEVRKNNTGLKALQQQLAADSLSFRTGIFPANPDLEFAYFFGRPDELSNKVNISFVQSFDFPTAYTHRNRIAQSSIEQLSQIYEKQVRELLLEARLISLNIIYLNALAIEYEKRLDHARQMVDAYNRMFEAGQSGIIELNKVKLNFLNLQKESEQISVDRQALLQQLQGLNGGIEIGLNETSFDVILIPSDFDQWYENTARRIPHLRWLKMEADISRKQEKLQVALNLPGLSAGYVSEEFTFESFRGFVVGISIPLWENKNRLKHIKSKTHAIENLISDQEVQFYNHLKRYHISAISIQATLKEYKPLVQSVDSSDLLRKSWEEGELSLTGYLLELSYFYESVENILKLEWELNKAAANLNQFSGVENPPNTY